MEVVEDGDLLVTMVASGVVDAYEVSQQENMLPVPYPANLQRALDRLTAFALANGQRAPAGVAELFRWCAVPLGDHFPGVSQDLGGEVFLHEGVPTRSAREWALTACNAEAERVERRVVTQARSAARTAGSQDAYITFRQLVIERPVLSALDFNRLVIEPGKRLVEASIREAYTAAGPEFIHCGEAVACADCRHLLVFANGTAECRNDRCLRTGPTRLGARFDATEDIMHLKEGIRMSVSSPGVAEMRLYKKLTGPKYRNAGLTAHLWPSYDAYDLGLVFPDDTVWAVDVKDWSNPVRLAKEAKPIPPLPAVPGGKEWSKAFLVPSDDCRRPVPEYIKTLKQRLKQRTSAVNFEAITERSLLQRVGTKLFEKDAHA